VATTSLLDVSRRDLWRAAVISFFIALIVVGGASAALPSLPTTMLQTQRGMVQQYTVIPWWVWALLAAFIFGIAILDSELASASTNQLIC
jgi:hypothetical protein